MADPDGQRYGLHERLAGPFGAGGDVLYAFAARVGAAVGSEPAAYSGPVLREETP